MTLLLLHGPAKTASRKRLVDQKLKFDQNNVIVFDSGANLQTILGNLASSSLFSEERLIILENPSEDFTNFPLTPNPYTLILWFDHEVSGKKPVIEWFKKEKGQIIFFPEAKETSIFPFLDYLTAKDNRAFLEMEKLKNAGFDIQYFITMVFYQLRNLVATPQNARQFVVDKLQRQRKNFSLEKMTDLYKEIIEIDFKIKSGLLEKDQAEFLLINLFGH